MIENRIWQLAAKKLAGEANPEEIRELESLLRQNPDMHYALQNLNDLWHLPSKSTGQEADAFSRHLQRMENAGITLNAADAGAEPYEQPGPVAGKRNRVYITSLVLAFFALCITIAYFRYSDKKQNGEISGSSDMAMQKNEVSANNGSRILVTLPDGSKVKLNSGSILSYSKDFGTGSRIVELSGEGFFDVVHNEDLPFIIHTQQVEIKVLGTMFNVKSYPGERETETSLVRGKVEVSVNNNPEQKYFLLPNQKLTVKNDIAKNSDTLIWREKTVLHKTDIPLVSLDNLKASSQDTSVKMETAWAENKLAFENETFEVLAQKMERWYGVNIEFRDFDLRSIRIRGIFENETLEQALDALSVMADGFRYRIKNKTVQIFK